MDITTTRTHPDADNGYDDEVILVEDDEGNHLATWYQDEDNGTVYLLDDIADLAQGDHPVLDSPSRIAPWTRQRMAE